MTCIEEVTDRQTNERAIGDCVLAKISQYDYHTGDENDDSVDN